MKTITTSYDFTCVHHTTAERIGAGCPVCRSSQLVETSAENDALRHENTRMRRALEVLRDRRDWISATDVDAFIRNALSV